MKVLQPLLWGCLFIIWFSNSAIGEVVVIANNSVPQTTLSVQDMEMIFLGKMNKWDDGEKIRLAVLRKGKAHEDFLKKYINKTPAKFSNYWKLIIVSGTGYPPKYFSEESDLIDYIESKKGSIGYVSKESLRNSVRVIHVK